MANEFQVSSLTECLTVLAKADCINYQQQQTPDACDEIMAVEQQDQSNTIFFQNSNLRWCNKNGIGSMRQKYCNGLTLSLQQHEKIRLKQLFHATEIFCILLSFRCQTSQPYSNAGKQ